MPKMAKKPSRKAKQRRSRAGLTPRQERFCAEYLIDLNATAAAERAGYSAKTAYSIGQENLKKPEIQKAIEAGRQKQQERTQVTADNVLNELAAIGFARITDAVEWDDTGLKIVESLKLPAGLKAAIREIEIDGSKKKIKMHDKIKALVELGKHLGLWDNKTSGADQQENTLAALVKSIRESKK